MFPLTFPLFRPQNDAIFKQKKHLQYLSTVMSD